MFRFLDSWCWTFALPRIFGGREGLGALKGTMKGHISDVLDNLDERCNVVSGIFEESVEKVMEGEIGGFGCEINGA
jgi:hypothetical protein